ncbi:MAG TPA: hypothetical protein PKV35_02570 [bacterium]|nr:hypothetical protein [bacterium]
MRNILIILFLTVFWSCTSCNGENSSDIDHESVADKDSNVNSDSDLSDEVLTEADETSDVDTAGSDPDVTDFDLIKQDKDTQPDESDDIELPDYDYPAGKDGDPACPNLLNAGFPYKDGDGKLTFCRKCDLPAPANDPQCVRNLWEMNNRRIVEEYPEYYCYPLPCDVTEKAIKNDAPTIGKCDFEAVSKIYHGSTGVFKQGDIWEGKIGMYATAGKQVDGKYMVIGSLLYDITTQEYTMVAHAREKQAYKYGRFLFRVGNTYDGKTYIASALKVDDGWKYEMVYTNEARNVEFIYPPAVGENYVIMNVHKAVNIGEDAGPEDILYASVNDWKWTKLGEGKTAYSQIHGDTAFFSYNSSVWACDLSKSPTDIETGCRKVNREGEKATAPAVKRTDENLVIYTAEEGYHQLYMADITNEEIIYTKLDLEKSSDLISFIPGQWDGDILVLEELYQFSEVDVDYRVCYYSVSKDKKVCFPNPDPYGNPMGYVYSKVEGKYIMWQPTGGHRLRDMECYCKEYPDLCLYDEYMPETPVLKKK